MKQKSITRTYGKIRWAILKKFDLTPGEALLMVLVSGLTARKGFCYASKQKLADYLNVSVPTIHNLIRSLSKKELLIRERRDGFGTSCLWTTNVWGDFMDEMEKIP